MARYDHAVPQLHDFLIHSARRLPEKVALVSSGSRLTYAELDARSNALAHALVGHGVQRGHRVVVFADNTASAVIGFWSALKANAVISVVNPLTKADKLAYLLNDCRAVALVTEARHWPTVTEAARRSPHLRAIVVAGELPRARAGDLPVVGWEAALAAMPRDAPPERTNVDADLAAIIYTSGSTGEPKGVMLTHRNMLTAAASITAYLENVEDDVVYLGLPLAFNYGLYQMIMTCRFGGRLVLDRSFAFPVEALGRMAEEGVTGFPGVPTVFAMLAELADLPSFDLSRVRYVTNTAAPLPVKHIGFLEGLFPNARIYSMYGLTECKRCTYLPPEDLERKPLSVGIPVPNTELWVVDEHDERLGPGQVGQLVVRGSTVMRGYWEKPVSTAERLRPGPIPGEVVLYTGDYCWYDDEGYFYFVDRMDDIIKSRGEKVAPKEVENALMNIRGVKEAAVVGVDDALLGKAIKAFVVLDAGAALTAWEIQRECEKQIEGYMVPKHVVFIDSLPKTSTGKIKRAGLA